MGTSHASQQGDGGDWDFKRLARERKRVANVLYRQRKKAAAQATAAALQEQAAAVDAERAQHAALRNEAAALDALASYQAQLAATLQQAAQADAVDSFVDGCLIAMDTQQGGGAVPSPVFEELASGPDSWGQQLPASSSSDCSGAESLLPPTGDEGWRPLAPLAAMAMRLRATEQPEGQAPPSPPPPPQQLRSASASASDTAAAVATAMQWAEGCSSGQSTGASDQPLSGLEWAVCALQALQQDSSSGAAAEAAAAGATDVPPLAGSGQQQSSAVQQLLQDFSVCLAVQYQPAEWQKRLFLRLLPASELVRRQAFFLSQLQTALDVWDACPALRPEVEGVIARRFAERNDIAQLLVDVRPQSLLDTLQPRMCPPPPADTPPSLDGRPPLSPWLLPVARYMESVLQPRHLGLLEQRWHAYQQSIAAIHKKAAAAALQAQWTVGLHEASWRRTQQGAGGGGTSERAEAWSGVVESGDGLGGFVGEVAAASWALQGTLNDILTPIQQARALMQTNPYTPDLSQLAPWLLSGRGYKPSATAGSSGGLRCDPGHLVAPVPAR